MVKIHAPGIIRSMLAASCLAASVCHASCIPADDKNFEPEMCDVMLPPMAHIDITDHHGDGAEREPDCNSFRPGIPEIYRFFSRAKSVSQQAWSHELTWVSCYVSGTVVFKDGRKGSWHVRASAIGTIDIEGPAPVTFHLYCPDCRFHPFWLGE